MRKAEDLPPPTRLTVETLASREFPDAELSGILAILDHYGDEPHEAEIHRVHLAILKLSEGRMDLLESGVESARADYRDVLANAEYPAEMAAEGSDATMIAGARRGDKEQYRVWLDRP